MSGNQTYAIYLYADDYEWLNDESANTGYNFEAASYSITTGWLPFTSNIECPGVWVFCVDKEELVLPNSM